MGNVYCKKSNYLPQPQTLKFVYSEISKKATGNQKMFRSCVALTWVKECLLSASVSTYVTITTTLARQRSCAHWRRDAARHARPPPPTSLLSNALPKYFGEILIYLNWTVNMLNQLVRCYIRITNLRHSRSENKLWITYNHNIYEHEQTFITSLKIK